MTEGDRIAALGIVLCLAGYAVFATADIPVITGGARMLPRAIRRVHQTLVEAFPVWTRSKGRAVVELSTVAVFTQLLPVIFLIASSIQGVLRGMAVVELVLAALWTAYLFGINHSQDDPRPPA